MEIKRRSNKIRTRASHVGEKQIEHNNNAGSSVKIIPKRGKKTFQEMVVRGGEIEDEYTSLGNNYELGEGEGNSREYWLHALLLNSKSGNIRKK